MPWLAVTNPNKIYNFNSQKVFDSLQSAIDDPDTLEFDLIMLGKIYKKMYYWIKHCELVLFQEKTSQYLG